MSSKKIIFDSFTVSVGVQSATWNPTYPHLTGDEELIQQINGELASHEGFSVTPTGPFVESDISQAASVYMAILKICDETAKIINPPNLTKLWLDPEMLDKNGVLKSDIIF